MRHLGAQQHDLGQHGHLDVVRCARDHLLPLHLADPLRREHHDHPELASAKLAKTLVYKEKIKY